MRDDPAVIDLVARARDGDARAWNEIVDRYAPLVWFVCRRYRLSRADVDDIGQTVWLLLVEQLGNLRQPAALPGWLATTTQRECLRVLRVASKYDHSELPEASQAPRDQPAEIIEQEIIEAELGAAVRTAFAELPERCRRLLAMLTSDPPMPYAQISAALSISVGSIGPQRARCLNRLRRSPALAAFADAVPDSAGSQGHGATDGSTHKIGGGRRA
jgi:RNA polymerase sigma factor (sigma-70 family)